VANVAEGLSREELEQQQGEALPAREAMSLLNSNIAIPVNIALATNILSDNSLAYASAEQSINITQTT
jgi:hypothetical protein